MNLLLLFGARTSTMQGLAGLLLTILAVLLASAASRLATPEPPLWDNAFRFIAAVEDLTMNQTGSMQYNYRWDILAASQISTDIHGREFTILQVKDNTWRVSPANRTCCLCVNPDSCGHVLPPAPDWLRRGNTTKYVGVTVINERPCQGWIKSDPQAIFGWWTSVKTNTPCQLSWLMGRTVNFVMSYYTNDIGNIPAAIFDVPSYCPYYATDPNCNITGFGG